MSRLSLAPLRVPIAMLLLLLLVVPATSGGGATPSDSVAPTHAPFLGPRDALPAGVVPASPEQVAGDDVTFELLDLGSAFGPETYKEDHRLAARDPAGLTNTTTDWSTALGHRLTVQISVTGPDGGALPCERRFVPEAFVATDQGPLWGWVLTRYETDLPDELGAVCPPGEAAVHVYDIVFDIDGTPPTLIPEMRFPALASGPEYALTFNVYHRVNPSPTNPGGQGPLAGSFQMPFATAALHMEMEGTPFHRFPESTMRLFSDVGAIPGFTDHLHMVPRPIVSSDAVNVTIGFTGAPVGATFERVDHYATRTGPGVHPPIDPTSALPPLEGAGQQLDNADSQTVTLQSNRPSLQLDKVPDSRLARMTMRAADFSEVATPLFTYVPMQVVTIHLPATLQSPVTGVATMVVPVSDQTFPVRGIDADSGTAGVTGATEITLQDTTQTSGGPTGVDAGDLFALSGCATTHEVLGRSTLQRDAGSPWVEGRVSHPLTFEDPPACYTLMGWLYGPSDEFLGMSMLRRGVGIDVDAVRLVEGTTGELTLTVTNLAENFNDVDSEADFALVVAIRSTDNFPDGAAFNHTTGPIPEGESVTITVPVNAVRPGDFNVRFTATDGELAASTESNIQVISKEQAREENRKWYSIPGPSVVLVLIAAIGLASLLRQRHDRAP